MSLSSTTIFFRRALRPEDLGFVDFDTPISDAGFDSLSSLMAQRILLCIDEADERLLPPAAAFEPAWRAFYADDVRRAGGKLLETLEAHAFAFVASTQSLPIEHSIGEQFDSGSRCSIEQKKRLVRTDYENDGLRFILIQHVPLFESVLATGRFLPADVNALFSSDGFATTRSTLRQRMEEYGLRTGRHSYWQFYLPGSLAVVNLLQRLARSPLSLAEYVGARLVLEAERAALAAVFCPATHDAQRGEILRAAEGLRSLLGDRLGEETAAAVSAAAMEEFDTLPLDAYTPGDHRFRRYSTFRMWFDDGEWHSEQQPQRSFLQPKSYNGLVGGTPRSFEPVRFDPAPQMAAAFERIGLDRTTHHALNVHQIRVITSDRIRGVLVPEGPHRDGHALVLTAVFRRHNIDGGVSQLIPLEGGEPFYSTTLEPGQAMVVEDERMLHFATDIVSRDGSLGYRDIWIVSINPWEARRYGEDFERRAVEAS